VKQICSVSANKSILYSIAWQLLPPLVKTKTQGISGFHFYLSWIACSVQDDAGLVRTHAAQEFKYVSTANTKHA